MLRLGVRRAHIVLTGAGAWGQPRATVRPAHTPITPVLADPKRIGHGHPFFDCDAKRHPLSVGVRDSVAVRDGVRDTDAHADAIAVVVGHWHA